MPIRVANLFITLVNIFLSISGFFIGLRIILKLVSANPATPFVSWIYQVSDFFISPFRGIFPNLGTQTGVLDIVAIIAILGYILVGYFLIEVFRSLAKTEVATKSHSTVHYHDIDEDLGDEDYRRY